MGKFVGPEEFEPPDFFFLPKKKIPQNHFNKLLITLNEQIFFLSF